MKFLSVCRAGPPFFASSLRHDLFIKFFSQFPYQKIYGVMHELYISWLGSYRQQMSNAMTANVKCIVTWLYVGKKRKNIFMASFYGWGSTASRLKPLRGGSLLFTAKFPEISGTPFNNLERMKGWVDLGATQWTWTRDPWIENPAPWPLGHYSLAN